MDSPGWKQIWVRFLHQDQIILSSSNIYWFYNRQTVGYGQLPFNTVAYLLGLLETNLGVS